MSTKIICNYVVPTTGTQSEAALQAALAAVPLDLDSCRVWGVMPISDATSNAAGSAQRIVQLQFDASAVAPVTAQLGAGGGGSVVALVLGAQANYWTAPPAITFAGTFVEKKSGVQASARAVMGVGQAVVAAQGSGYNAATTTAAVVGGQLASGGTPATVGAVSVVGGKVTGVTVVSQGSGYNAFPQIVITDSSGTGSGAEVFGGLTIVSLQLLNPGFGYAPAPTVTVSPAFSTYNNISNEGPTDANFTGWMTRLIQNALRSPVQETLPSFA